MAGEERVNEDWLALVETHIFSPLYNNTDSFSLITVNLYLIQQHFPRLRIFTRCGYVTIFKEFLHYTRLNSQSQMESGRINCKWKYNGSRRCRSAVSHLSQAGANWVRCGHICNLHIIMLEDRKIVSWWGEQEFDKETEATTIKCCRRMIYLIMHSLTVWIFGERYSWLLANEQ